MSPVSRRRSGAGAKSATNKAARSGRSSRRVSSWDQLTGALESVRESPDAFQAAAAMTTVFGHLDVGGRTGDGEFAAFCVSVLSDDRAATSIPGLLALAALADLGHQSIRQQAQQILLNAAPDMREQLPSWASEIGDLTLVSAGAVQDIEGSEAVVHALFDYARPTAGRRHLVSLHVEHATKTIHLLDVRGREAGDTLTPVGHSYRDRTEVRWVELDAAGVVKLVAGALTATDRRRPEVSVVGVDGAATLAWTLGIRRIEQLAGRSLRPSYDG